MLCLSTKEIAHLIVIMVGKEEDYPSDRVVQMDRERCHVDGKIPILSDQFEVSEEGYHSRAFPQRATKLDPQSTNTG